MGDRALVGETIKDGKIRVYYSHWGALNAWEGDLEVPEEEDEERYVLDNAEEFGKHIDYLHIEAIWLDGRCYYPFWIFPSDKINVHKWKTEGEGILIECTTNEEFNRTSDEIHKLKEKLQKENPELNLKELKDLIIKCTVAKCGKERIPYFSPYGTDIDEKEAERILIMEEL